jgi:hypothetical protein
MTFTSVQEFPIEGTIRSNVTHPSHLFTRYFALPSSTYEIWNYEFFVGLGDVERRDGKIVRMRIQGKPVDGAYNLVVQMKPEETELNWWFAPYAKGEVLLLLSEIRGKGITVKRVAYWFVTDVYSEQDADFIRGRIFQWASQVGFNDEGKSVMGYWVANQPTGTSQGSANHVPRMDSEEIQRNVP